MFLENRPKPVSLSEGGVGSDTYKKLKCPECGKDYKWFTSWIRYMHGMVQLCSYNCRYKYAEKHPLETKDEKEERLEESKKRYNIRRTSDSTQRYHNDPEYRERMRQKARERYNKNKNKNKNPNCDGDKEELKDETK